MRKSTKVLLWIGGTFLAIGIIFCIAGVVMGYRPGTYLRDYQQQMQNLEEQLEDSSNKGVHIQTYQDITSVKFSIGAAVCKVMESDQDKVQIMTLSEQYLNAEKSGHQLNIEYGKNSGALNWLGLNEAIAVIVYLPKDQIMDEIELESGAAQIDMENLSCKQLIVSGGAGSFSYSGTVENTVSAECGMGELTLQLTGKPEDYNYKLDCGIGEIQIEQQRGITGAGDKFIDNHANKNMHLSCGLGRIAVSFAH